MLVSGHTIQLWLNWDNVSKDILSCVEHIDKKDNDIIMFTPRITEMNSGCKNLIDLLKPDYTISHNMKHGTIFIKRVGVSTAVVATAVGSTKSLIEIIKEQKVQSDGTK